MFFDHFPDHLPPILIPRLPCKVPKQDASCCRVIIVVGLWPFHHLFSEMWQVYSYFCLYDLRLPGSQLFIRITRGNTPLKGLFCMRLHNICCQDLPPFTRLGGNRFPPVSPVPYSAINPRYVLTLTCQYHFSPS